MVLGQVLLEPVVAVFAMFRHELSPESVVPIRHEGIVVRYHFSRKEHPSARQGVMDPGSPAWFRTRQQRELTPFPMAVDVRKANRSEPDELRLDV